VHRLLTGLGDQDNGDILGHTHPTVGDTDGDRTTDARAGRDDAAASDNLEVSPTRG